MRLTKFVHSCIFVETTEFSTLIDPGSFTFDSHLLNVSMLARLDYIVITHEHSDHYHEGFLRLLSRRFPHAEIVTNDHLLTKIAKLKLANPMRAGSDDNLLIFKAAHEPLPLDLPEVANIGVHISDKFTHPGDSFAFEHTREVLALPMTGPWGSMRDALGKVVKLKPKIVIPVHDWEWHRSAREARYEMSERLLKPHGIKFMALDNAESIEI